ncbi:Hly-III-related protein [Penicillium freii]|nr:Hly-III-related protein [Penicillium freii]
MDSIHRQPSRPPTVWYDGIPDWNTFKRRPTYLSTPSSGSYAAKGSIPSLEDLAGLLRPMANV